MPIHHSATQCIHGGLQPDPVTGAILTPIFQSTTFVQPALGSDKGYTYSRAANPTNAALERALASIEYASGAVAFSTGMGAIACLLLTVLQSNDHVVCSDVVYGGTVRFLDGVLKKLGVECTFADTSNEEQVRSVIKSNTRLLFVESPANPTLKVTDIEAMAKIAKTSDLVLAVDNTFLTPILQRPLDLGANVSVYSTTKFIEGHNSTLGGALVSRDDSLLGKLRFFGKTLGATQSPLESWLTLRGLKTLPLRMARHGESALCIARWLESDPRVESVYYTGLPSHPQHAVAKKQQSGHGGVISFELESDFEGVRRLLGSLKLVSLAENLGAVESLITHPFTMTHSDVSMEQRQRCGVTQGLVRLSVGLEDVEDIIQDLDQALKASEGRSS